MPSQGLLRRVQCYNARMGVRRIWLGYLATSEPVVSTQAENLVQTLKRPGDVRELARRLGATIVSLPENSRGTGYLSGQTNDWTVKVKGDVGGELDEKQRFTVAHELAHALFFNLGEPPGPSSEGEYWLLEECCNRVAELLLATESQNADRTGSPGC